MRYTNSVEEILFINFCHFCGLLSTMFLVYLFIKLGDTENERQKTGYKITVQQLYDAQIMYTRGNIMTLHASFCISILQTSD